MEAREKKKTYPKEWEARPLDVKSGWKNNAKVLADMVTAINDELYVEDENGMMEYLDVLLEHLKSKYKIELL